MNLLIAKILRARGLDRDFLHPKYENLTPPEQLPDMEKAVKRLKKAKKSGEKILIYGDYDVDGVTATATVVETLKLMGFTGVDTMLPDRFLDGYGMSKRLVKRAAETGVSLVITVDCGSNNAEIINELAEKGIDTLVTDHHELSGAVPERAVAVVNPKRPDFQEKLKKSTPGSSAVKSVGSAVPQTGADSLVNLSGAGVAFMLAKALVNAGEIPAGQEKWLLDLTMIGTICDSMKLLGDNRIICHFGMKVLGVTRRKGLIALMRAAGVSKINSEAIGFQIGPRLNAAGRMQTAELALNLLLTNSNAEAAKLAETLNRLNSERRSQQNQATRELEENGIDDSPVIVVKGNWGEGVIGIIAGRLTERYKKPSFVLTEADGELKGSGRSFGEFNLALALGECQDFLLSGGGHAEACGLKIKSADFERFKEAVNNYYTSLHLKNQQRFLEVKEDVAIQDFKDLNLEFLADLSLLEPFGEGNPAPVFLLSGVKVLARERIGADGKHLRMLVLSRDEKVIKLVAFNAEESWQNVEENIPVNIWVELTENEWRGEKDIEGRILRLEYP